MVSSHWPYRKTELAPGNQASASQRVQIFPIADFGLSQTIGEGSDVTVVASLNVAAAQYPVEIRYTVSGTAINPDDHDAASGTLVFESGREASITFRVKECPQGHA